MILWDFKPNTCRKPRFWFMTPTFKQFARIAVIRVFKGLLVLIQDFKLDRLDSMSFNLDFLT